MAVGDADAVDGLGGIERGVDVEEAAVGGPDGVGAGGDGEGGPGAGGDVEEADLALVEGEGGDPAAVGRPARAEEVVGAGDLLDLVGVEVEDVEGARGVFLAHVVVDAAEDEGLAVGGPGGVGGVAGFAEQRMEVVAFGADDVDLPGLAGFAGHEGEVFAVGRPAGEEDGDVVRGELDFFVAVAAGAPELAAGVGPGDPLAVAGVADADGGAEEAFFGDELAGGIEVLELGAGVDAEEEDAIAGAGGDGRAELQRAVGEADGIGGGRAGEAPEVGVSAATGLEDEVAAVGGPDAAALGGGLAEVGKHAAGVCGRRR